VSAYYEWNRLVDMMFDTIDGHMEHRYGVRLADDTSLTTVYRSIRDELARFPSVPFTIQRLSELVWRPPDYYRQPIKYLRAIEKCAKVWSSQLRLDEVAASIQCREVPAALDGSMVEHETAVDDEADDPLLTLTFADLDDYAKQVASHREIDSFDTSFDRSLDSNDLFQTTTAFDKFAKPWGNVSAIEIVSTSSPFDASS
jgi:hypothetical protein